MCREYVFRLGLWCFDSCNIYILLLCVSHLLWFWDRKPDFPLLVSAALPNLILQRWNPPYPPPPLHTHTASCAHAVLIYLLSSYSVFLAPSLYEEMYLHRAHSQTHVHNKTITKQNFKAPPQLNLFLCVGFCLHHNLAGAKKNNQKLLREEKRSWPLSCFTTSSML